MHVEPLVRLLLDQLVPLLSDLADTTEHATGTSDSMKNISQETIRRIPIMLPTLPEQHTIVRRLERDMAEIERMRAAADRQRVAVEELLGAYLREIFESEEAREWPIVRLGSVGAIGSGVTLGKLYPEGQARSVPYLRVANVKDGYLDLSSIYEIAVPERDIEKSRLQFGDLLLTEGGDPDKLGRGTFWHDELQECIHQNHIFRVRFDLNRFSPQFLSAQIGSSYGKQYFLAHAKQTTGIATINQKVLANFPLMAPSTIIQREVVERIDNQMTEVKHIQQEAERQHKVIEALPEELLREVFG